MKVRYILSVFIIALVSFSSFAQNTPVVADSILPPVELNEAVIKASKNNAKLKDLPASVSILHTSVIESNGIGSLNQATSISPNFVMPEYGSKLTSPLYIRGIGSRINAPSVGLYVDNVPYFEKSMFNFDFFDIEKIEILRGPQGTLYGRNSMGGIINVITRSPQDFQGNLLSVSAASFGTYKLNAGHYFKPNEKLAISLSGNYQHSDGFFTNEYNNTKIDKINSWGLRNRIIYSPNEHFSVENIAAFEQSKQGGYPYALYDDSLKTAADINYNQYSSYDRLMFSDALNLKYSTDRWELTNTLSYQFLDDNQNIDQDFTADSLHFITQIQRQNMISDEIIFRNKDNKRYSMIFGGFTFLQLFESEVDVNSYQSSLWYLKTYGYDVLGLALFHQSTYNVTDNFSVTGGLRYDFEKSGLDYTYDGVRNQVTLPSIDTTYPDLTDHILLPKLAMNYKFGQSSVFASYTTGYKPGGFNTTFELPEQLVFKNEVSHNFEAGIKTSLFSNLLYSDFAIFYTKLKNQQIYRTVPSGRGSYLDNAGISENKGVEFTLQTSPLRGFQGTVAYGYTHSKILEYVKDSVINYNHHFTPYIPRHTFSVQIIKTFLFKSSSLLDQLKLNVLYNQLGNQYWDLENKYREDRYGLLSAKISFFMNHFQFDVWAKNLLNQSYHSFLFEALGNTYVQNAKPMQVGANISLKF